MAIEFGGGNAHSLSLANDSTLEPTLTCSVAFWIYVNNFPGAEQAYLANILGDETSDVTFEFMVRLGSGGSALLNQRIGFRPNDDVNDQENDTDLTAGQWHHVACTYDSPSGAFYLDGAADGTFSDAGVTASVNRIWYFGRWGTSIGNFRSLDARLADFAYWRDRQLSADEVAELASGYSPLGVASLPTMYLPMWGRESTEFDVVGGRGWTRNSATAADHPPLIEENGPLIGARGPVVASNRIARRVLAQQPVGPEAFWASW